MSSLVYMLDGQPISLKALCIETGWSRDLVKRILRGEHPPLTRDALRAAVVSELAKPLPPRVLTPAQIRGHRLNLHRGLTNRAHYHE